MEVDDWIKVVDVYGFTESYLRPLLSVFDHVQILDFIRRTPWPCIQVHIEYEINSFQSPDPHISFLLFLGQKMFSMDSCILSVLSMMRMEEAEKITILVVLFDCLEFGALSI